MDSDVQGMELAIEEARSAKGDGEWPFGAAVLRNGKIVSRRHCTEAADKTVLAHAELQAVGDACNILGTNNLSDCVIYCTNEPCLMCAAAIFQAKIPRVVIGASRRDLAHLLRERQFRIDDLAKDSGYRPEIVRDLFKDKIIELFADVVKK